MKRNKIVSGAFLVLTVIALVLFVFAASMQKVSGQTEKTKTVTSVCIQRGDSLWSLAKEYYSDECGDFRDYLSEIRRTNNLPNDEITAGNYLLIPFYK